MAEYYSRSQLQEMALAQEAITPPPAILDCGHAPHVDSYFCGTFTTTDDGRRICWDCRKAERDDRILDCGHKPSPHSDITSGTAHTSDDREICYDCANKEEIAALLTADRYHGYTHRPKIGKGKHAGYAMRGEIRTWTGAALIPRAQFWTIAHNWYSTGGKLWAWSGEDVHGQTWYGRCAASDGYITSMHKAKKDRKAAAAPVAAPIGMTGGIVNHPNGAPIQP